MVRGMKDYVKDMMEAWTSDGEQSAYLLARELLQGIRSDIIHLQRQESAIQALAVVLREHPDVDTSVEPRDPEPGLDMIESSERPRVIVQAAREAYQERESTPWTATGKPLIKTEEVVEHLKEQGLGLGVQNPLAVIATVLANADGFGRIAKNTFEVHNDDNPLTFSADDLPF